MCDKFQGQDIYTQKNIQNLPTCVVVRMIFLAFGIVSHFMDKVSHGCKKIILPLTHVEYVFVNLLAFKFVTHFIYIEMVLCQKFHN